MPPTITARDGTQLDTAAVNLARAIRTVESGSKYDTTGKSGEKGAYQWMPGNFENNARKYGLDPSDFSPVNQDKVAYHVIKEYKDRGFTPEQVAAAWNAGEQAAISGEWRSRVGTNRYGVAYDTPKYVSDVVGQFQQLKGQGGNGVLLPPGTQSDSSSLNGYGAPVKPEPTQISPSSQPQIGESGGLVGAIQDLSQGAAKGAIQGLGTGLEGLVRLGGGIEGAIGMKKAQQGAQQSAEAISNFVQQPGLQAENNTEKVGKVIGQAADLVAPLPKVKALVTGVKAAESGLVRAPKEIARIAKTIAPKQTAKEAAAALQRLGGRKGGILRRARINPDPSVHRMAEAVAQHVPNFRSGGSAIENIGHVKKAVSRLAQDLEAKVTESGQNSIYPIRELNSAITKAIQKNDVSIGLKGTQFEKQAVALKDAALQIAREKGGRVSDLLPARKEFDDLVDKIYPNLYDREYSPIRNAVKSVRDAMTDFTEKHLPQDVGLKQSYGNQSKLIRVVENLAEKAVSGAEKEIEVGKSAVGRFVSKHPKITTGISTLVGYRALKEVPVLGDLLP